MDRRFSQQSALRTLKESVPRKPPSDTALQLQKILAPNLKSIVARHQITVYIYST